MSPARPLRRLRTPAASPGSATPSCTTSPASGSATSSRATPASRRCAAAFSTGRPSPRRPDRRPAGVCSSSSWAGLSLQRAPPAPLEASAGRPPAVSARRHRLADIRVTRNRAATSRSLAPSSIHSAAASRTRSRRARSSAVSPPPSGYLTASAKRTPRRRSTGSGTSAVDDLQRSTVGASNVGLMLVTPVTADAMGPTLVQLRPSAWCRPQVVSS